MHKTEIVVIFDIRVGRLIIKLVEYQIQLNNCKILGTSY